VIAAAGYGLIYDAQASAHRRVGAVLADTADDKDLG